MFIIPGNNDIVNINQQINEMRVMIENGKRCIRRELEKPKVVKKIYNS